MVVLPLPGMLPRQQRSVKSLVLRLIICPAGFPGHNLAILFPLLGRLIPFAHSSHSGNSLFPLLSIATPPILIIVLPVWYVKSALAQGVRPEVRSSARVVWVAA